MSLSLSTVAAPSADLDAFHAAANGRGLDGIELELDAAEDVTLAVERARASSARFVALHAAGTQPSGALARASGALGVPLSVPAERTAVLSAASVAELGRDFAAAGGRLLLGFRSDFDAVMQAVNLLREAGSPSAIGLAWELRPGVDDLEASGTILLAASELLGAVRLYGGGPEQNQQDGRGVGAIFVELALSGYAGPTVLIPSGAEQLPLWHDWLLTRKPMEAGFDAKMGFEVDVRNVEPKDRMGTILGAFGALPPGETMHITLDHDPSCMYYALEETQAEGSFAFRKIGEGPVVWEAEVKKLPV
ncbi:MAG: DUF2249 domain-containing protein [Sorangiineae bacterium]|nr:DUF2249 domain-containing protein [Polyangiaceae bacterium]MEB2323640.1 DUF2249 domain-containing protein [Sorangiineae bacterium]